MIKLEQAEYLGKNKRSFFLGHVTITETEYLSQVSEDWHYHINHHLSLIIAGGNCERRNGDQIQAYPGHVMIYPSELLHRNTNTTFPSRNINVEIDPEYFKKSGLNFSILNSDEAASNMLKMYKECVLGDSDSHASIQTLLLNIFHSPFRENSHSPKWAQLIRDILNDRWNENVSLEELSDVLQVHPVTVSKYFPKYFHCTLGQYTRKLKINKAIQLIKESDRSLVEIGAECGFFDQSHFIRTFTHLTGFSPRQFRKL